MKPRRKETQLPECEVTAVILESISEGVFTVDRDWHITCFNRAAEEITGIPRNEAIGRRCSEVFRASMCETDCALRATMNSGGPLMNRSAYIIDAHGQRIPVSVSTALLRDRSGQVIGGVETFRDLRVVEELRKQLEGRFELGDMVSRSPLMRRLFDIIPQVAVSDSAVLIQGETGTGKELLARAIHGLSPRAGAPFVTVNCGALPDTLLESELFGYKAGAFTGANKDKPGRFALAEGGTLFLDEVGDISPALQVRLLRILQEKTYEPLGGTTTVRANVRILAATNKDLASLVQAGTFRQDLYYRVHVVRLDLPPIRRRREDIPLLAEHFIRRLNHLQNRQVSGLSQEALGLFMAHDFPGNVRELENAIEHAFVLCGDGPIQPEHCPPELVGHLPQRSRMNKVAAATQAVEAQALLDALKTNHYDRLATARELGIHKSTLYRKVRSLGLQLPEEDGRSHRKRST